MKRIMRIAFVALFALSLISMAAQATLITEVGIVGGKNVSASADFSVASGDLQIILTNTGTLANYAMEQVLTDISFDMLGADITGGFVTVATGSILYDDGAFPRNTAITDVSGEWAWTEDGTLGPMFSISAASLGGTQTRFAAVGVDDPPALNGGDFGLINLASLNSDGLPNNWIIVDSVEIELTGTGFNLANLDNVHFSYGSAHTLVPPIPEPTTLLLLGSGLVGLAGYGKLRIRRRKKA